MAWVAYLPPRWSHHRAYISKRSRGICVAAPSDRPGDTGRGDVSTNQMAHSYHHRPGCSARIPTAKSRSDLTAKRRPSPSHSGATGRQMRHWVRNIPRTKPSTKSHSGPLKSQFQRTQSPVHSLPAALNNLKRKLASAGRLSAKAGSRQSGDAAFQAGGI